MKVVGIVLTVLLIFMASGCGTNSPVQNALQGVWQSEMLGGEGVSSGFSFITEFTFSGSGGGPISVSQFQFLTSIAGGCFPQNGEVPTGSFSNLTNNSALQIVTGNFSYVITANGNTLTLTSTSITGTLTSTRNAGLISGGNIQGTWALQGTGSCTNATGSFTMTQGSLNGTTTTTTTTTSTTTTATSGRLLR